MKKVSIIMPIYNAERFLKETLDSVCAQDYPNIEFIAVNDASTDSTPDILEEYRAAFERRNHTYIIVRCERNGGLCAAINEGLKRFTGEFLCFPDADDYLMPNYVSSMVSVLEKTPNSKWVRCGYVKVLENENREYELRVPERSVYKNDFFDFVSKFVPHNAWNMLVRSDYFVKVVGRQIYNSRLTQEWAMLLPLSFFSEYERCDEILYRYYIRTDAMSSWINKDIDYVSQHIDNLEDMNREIIASLKPTTELYSTVVRALSIYYTYFKLSICNRKGLADEMLKTHELLLSLTDGIIEPTFALAVGDSELITRFALDSLLEMYSGKPCEMYRHCEELFADGYILVTEGRGKLLFTATRMAFGEPREVIYSDERIEKDTAADNHLPVLLLIENSKTASEASELFCNTDMFVDYRYAQDALRGWAYLKEWKFEK